MDEKVRIQILRDKQERMPVLAEKWAQHIFEDIMQGDEFVDEAEALVMDIEPPEDFEDPENFTLTLDIYIDGLWSQILHKIHARIQTLNDAT